MYDNSKRTPTFLNNPNDTIKSQGKTNEDFISVNNNTTITTKYYDETDQLHGLFSITEKTGFLLGIPVDLNPNILNVKFSIDNTTFYDCVKLTESYYDNFNNHFTKTYWRATKEPILLTIINYVSLSTITFDILFVNNTNMRIPVYYTIGNAAFSTNLWYDTTKILNKIYLHPVDNVPYLYYQNNTINVETDVSETVDKNYMQISDLDYIYTRAENLIDYLQQDRS
jgi:hypothetical protein